MKILHINEKDVVGGAAVCMNRLNKALSTFDHSSHILVGRTEKTRGEVAAIRPQSLLSKISFHGLNLAGLNFAGILNPNRIIQHPLFQNADIIHLHNLHGGYFNYRHLPKLSNEKPLVWTLHDMWSFTGHCGHSFDCDRWQTGCGHCPYPNIYPAVRRDATHKEWRLKKNVYEQFRIHLVCPSKWLQGLVKQSILRDQPLHYVSSGIDLELFSRRNKTECRRVLGLPKDKNILLYVAQSMDDPFKDYAMLISALNQLSEAVRRESLLLIMGQNGSTTATITGMPVKTLGFVEDEKKKTFAYNAADLFVYPTKADNQPNALIEALACGCPSVSVQIGGVPELVDHNSNGRLVKAGDAAAMAREIENLLTNNQLRNQYADSAREKAKKQWGLKLYAEKMIAVYKEAIDDFKEQKRNE